MNPPPQSGPLFAFYGDDFTGSTDALESLASNGLSSVLFTQPPTDSQLAQFAHCRAIGIAGDSRSRTPLEMRDTLQHAFECLLRLSSPVVQYKICSTFDSSPFIGSIGCALEIGRQVFGVKPVPIVAAAPKLGRYVAFGNLFAVGYSSDDGIFRIDRHPTMSRHPVTPMDEADLRIHLSRQTSCAIGSFHLTALRASDAVERLARVDAGAVVFDGVTDADQSRAAELIWQNGSQPVFAIGSSGFTYGLLDFWRNHGWIPAAPDLPRAQPADRILAVAGSCSPATARQICWALNHGFAGIRVEPAVLDHAAIVARALDLLRDGRSLILYSALAPEDCGELQNREEFASRMGRLLLDIAAPSGIRRIAVAGGDTSSHAIRQTGIDALTYLAPLAPGAPLCRAHGGRLTGCEIVLKGGQVGRGSFFCDVLQGNAT